VNLYVLILRICLKLSKLIIDVTFLHEATSVMFICLKWTFIGKYKADKFLKR